MERGVLSFTAASSTRPTPAAASLLHRSVSLFRKSDDNCRQPFSASPYGNSRNSQNTISGRNRGNLSLKALNQSLSSNWDANTAAPSWIPSFEELDTTNMLLRQRIVFLGTQVDDMSADLVISQLLLLDAEDSKKDIKLFINSPGGSISAGMGIYDAMKLCKADITTICFGIAASMGAFILATGTKGKRFCMPNARVMLHQPRKTAGSNKIIETLIRLREMNYNKLKMQKILSRISGKSVEQLDLDTEHDIFMNAWEAKDYGLVDAVVDDGKPGLVAPLADNSRPPRPRMRKFFTKLSSWDNLPSEENLVPNGYFLEQDGGEDKGSEQKEEASTPL